MKAILFDLDGVFYEGDRPVKGGADTIAWVRDRDIPHLFLTNTTSRDRTALVDKLSAMGIAVAPEQILTPPVAAVEWLKQNADGSVALFVPDATRNEFAELPLYDDSRGGPPAAVVMGDLGEGWDFATLNKAFRLLMAEHRPRLVALGMTRYWKAPDGLRLDVAPFVMALAHAAGVEPVVLGKPSSEFYGTALDILQVGAHETVIVGDDIRSDIDGAQRCGMRGVLVRTGKFRSSDLDGGVTPAAVLDSISDLKPWWEDGD